MSKTSISFADCPEQSCDCIPPTGGVKSITSSTTVNSLVGVGAGVSLEILDSPSWASSAIVGSDINITGSAPVGQHTIVYEISNQCGKECLVVKVNVASACVAPSNIVRDIGYKNDTLKIEADIPIPNGGSLVSCSIQNANVRVYASDISISADLQEPIPATYLVSMSTPCGDYTISGNLIECRLPILDSIAGSSVLEKGVPFSYSWVVSGTGAMSVQSQAGIPSGAIVSVAQNTPTSGMATISVSGTPVDNPGLGESKILVKAQCGTIQLSRKFTQQPCRSLVVVGEIGSSLFVVNQPANYCKILSGYEPSLADFSGLPPGTSVSVSPHSVLGQWIVCVSGTPIVDPCEKLDAGKLCKCAEVKLKNECGDFELNICYNLDATGSPARPSFCVGQHSYDPATRLLKVWNISPSSVVTVSSSYVPSTPITITADNTGYCETIIPVGLTYGCVILSHPTCSLLPLAPSNAYCPPPPPPGP